jgi:ATP adenylyltransferase
MYGDIPANWVTTNSVEQNNMAANTRKTKPKNASNREQAASKTRQVAKKLRPGIRGGRGKGTSGRAASSTRKTQVRSATRNTDSVTENNPLYREIFFRPERRDYVRKQDKPEFHVNGCVFCYSSAHDCSLESLKVWDGQHVMIVLNKFPYNTGHLLVLPKRHVGELENLTPQELSDLSRALQSSVKILKDVYNCPGLNVGMNLGTAAGAGIPDHLHLHVVPRWVGDTNFFPLLANTKVVIERLEDTFARLLPLFQKAELL